MRRKKPAARWAGTLCQHCRRAAMLSVQRSSASVSVGAAVGRCRNSVSASRYTVGVDVAADGDAGDPQQPGGRPHREPLQLRLLDRLPAGELPGCGSAELLVRGLGCGGSTVARHLHRRGGSRERGEPPGYSSGAGPEAMRSWSGFRASSERAALPESTEEERASGCGWVLRCSWDNGFCRITSQQGAPIRC